MDKKPETAASSCAITCTPLLAVLINERNEE